MGHYRHYIFFETDHDSDRNFLQYLIPQDLSLDLLNKLWQLKLKMREKHVNIVFKDQNCNLRMSL